MKMRKLRKVIWDKMAPKVWDAYWQRQIDKAMDGLWTPEDEAASRARQSVWFDQLWADIAKKAAQRFLVEPEPEDFPKEEPVTLGTLLRDRFAKQDAERMAAGG